jgi:hypothetical protein
LFHKASLQAVPSEHLPVAHALRHPLPGVAPSLRLEDAGVQVLVLTPLVFLGLVAFVRCLEIAIDDWEFVTRITRLRCTYDQLVPELAPLMSQAVADDGLVAMLSPRWQPFQKMLSVAGSVAVITSVVVGGDAGVIVFGVSRLLYLAIAVGAAAGALALGWASWYQWRHWCQASRPPSRDVPPGRAARADERPLPRAGAKNELAGMLRSKGIAGRHGQPGSWQPAGPVMPAGED